MFVFKTTHYQILLAGASYREDVGDTRYVEHWYELESQDTYPAPGHSWAPFFRNQSELVQVRVHPSTRIGSQAMKRK